MVDTSAPKYSWGENITETKLMNVLRSVPTEKYMYIYTEFSSIGCTLRNNRTLTAVAESKQLQNYILTETQRYPVKRHGTPADLMIVELNFCLYL